MVPALALLLAVGGPPAIKQASPAADLVDVTMDVCYALASGELKLGGTIEDDTKSLTDRRVVVGLKSATLDRMGREGANLVSQSIIGERESGGDTIVLAVGGRMPGCRSILLSKSAASQGADAARLLVTAGWKEAPATNLPGSLVNRRMFVRRDAKGQPYLINMISGGPPQSDVRIITTVNRIPPGVQLPQGF